MAKDKPLVSVVIPAYNEQRYIQRCIDSIVLQSYEPLEIIFVDDGSKDDTYTILKKNASWHKGIRVYRQKNAGPGAARNRGAKLAKGKILIFVDADMTFDKRYVETLVKPIIEGKTHGTTHTKELCANKENIWARSWSINRIDPRVVKNGCPVYRAVLRKKFFDVDGFDPGKGYFDDNLAELGNATPIPAICYHNNPETIGEAFQHSMWVGRSLVRNPATRIPVKAFTVGSFVAFLLSIALLIAGITLPISIVVSCALLSWIIMSVSRTAPRIITEQRYEYLFSIPIIWLVRLGGYYLGALQQVYRELR